MELERGIGQRSTNPKWSERWAECPDQHRLLFCSGQDESGDQHAGAGVNLGARGNVRDCGWVDRKLPGPSRDLADRCEVSKVTASKLYDEFAVGDE